MIKKLLATAMHLLLVLNVFSQQKLTLQQAEQLLQKNNLLLLAEQFNINASQAAVIQAKIWDQPYVFADLNAINPGARKLFDIGPNGQKAGSIQQLIYLGGKKRSEVDFAKSNLSIAEIQYEQLLRNLNYQLYQFFYNQYYDGVKLQSLDAQIKVLDDLSANYKIQAAKGNIPLKEAVRLQTLMIGLKAERIDLLNDIAASQKTLSLLTGALDSIQPTLSEQDLLNKYNLKIVTKDEITQLAMANNLDFKLTTKLAENQELYLKWQKTLAVPDLTAGLNYDQGGGAFKNQVNFSVGIPLPLWNSNKGNIKMAEYQFAQAKTNIDYKKLELQAQAINYYNVWLQQREQWRDILNQGTANINEVYQGMILNFQKRNITLLEFTDYMESYNQTFIQISEAKKAFILAAIDINYITNSTLF